MSVIVLIVICGDICDLIYRRGCQILIVVMSVIVLIVVIWYDCDYYCEIIVIKHDCSDEWYGCDL